MTDILLEDGYHNLMTGAVAQRCSSMNHLCPHSYPSFSAEIPADPPYAL